MIRTLALLLLLVAGAARAQPFTVADFATGLDHPWGATFLPDGRLLVTERPGRLRLDVHEQFLVADGHGRRDRLG